MDPGRTAPIRPLRPRGPGAGVFRGDGGHPASTAPGGGGAPRGPPHHPGGGVGARGLPPPRPAPGNPHLPATSGAADGAAGTGGVLRPWAVRPLLHLHGRRRTGPLCPL
ncbi:hypothetical protein B5F22_09350 [Pseudoflavonifractor sp. An187]|nr:hypothetical protein B5F22_09350 [Pseudoflavonifractor sp. An187]